MKSNYAALTRHHGVEAKIFVRPAASEKEEVIHPNTTISNGEPHHKRGKASPIQERWELSELQREGDLPKEAAAVEEPTTETDPNNLSVISNHCVFESLPLVYPIIFSQNYCSDWNSVGKLKSLGVVDIAGQNTEKRAPFCRQTQVI